MRKLRKKLLLAALFSVGVFLIFSFAETEESPEIFRKEEVKYPFTFIVYGDSREPAGYEKDALIEQIIKENPSFVIHLGDMVKYGEEHEWKIFDIFDGRIIEKGIPFYPVLGNHEYYTKKEGFSADPTKQLGNYFNKFKFLGLRRWYSFRYGNSLFLVLDTNADHSPQSRQCKWLTEELKKESPGFLFVAFHHPPYTKSTDKSPRESEIILAEILESYGDKKLANADIVFSSHAHNYERYRHNGINYIVSGGGGVYQYPVARDPDDFYTKDGDTYHYCKITVSEKQAIFQMIRLDENTNEWIIDDSFTVSK